MSLDRYTITISGQWLSDMFFNFGHENYARVVDDANATADDVRRAVEADATDFLMNIPADQYVEGLHSALVEDFLRRL